jgi:hypothetical protein
MGFAALYPSYTLPHRASQMDFATLYPSYRTVPRSLVGSVERSETHHSAASISSLVSRQALSSSATTRRMNGSVSARARCGSPR